MGILDANDIKLIGEEVRRVLLEKLPRIEALINRKFDENFAKFGASTKIEAKMEMNYDRKKR
jgi:predicted nucleotidyltransferase